MTDPYAVYANFIAQQQARSNSLLDMIKFKLSFDERKKEFAAQEEQRKFGNAQARATLGSAFTHALSTLPIDEARRLYPTIRSSADELGIQLTPPGELSSQQAADLAKQYNIRKFDPETGNFYFDQQQFEQLLKSVGNNQYDLMDAIDEYSDDPSSPYFGWKVGVSDVAAKQVEIGAAINKTAGGSTQDVLAYQEIGARIDAAIKTKQAYTGAKLFASPADAMAKSKEVLTGELAIAQTVSNAIRYIGSGSAESVQAIQMTVNSVDAGIANISNRIQELKATNDAGTDTLKEIEALTARAATLQEYRDNIVNAMANSKGYVEINNNPIIEDTLRSFEDYYSNIIDGLIKTGEESVKIGGTYTQEDQDNFVNFLHGIAPGVGALGKHPTMTPVEGKGNAFAMPAGLTSPLNDAVTVFHAERFGLAVLNVYKEVMDKPDALQAIQTATGINITTQKDAASAFSGLPLNRTRDLMNTLVERGAISKGLASTLLYYHPSNRNVGDAMQIDTGTGPVPSMSEYGQQYGLP